MTAKNAVNHDGLIALEQPLIKLPLEQIRKTIRTSQKYIEREIQNVQTMFTDISQKSLKSKAPDGTPGLYGADAAEASKSIEGLVGRLKNLKRKLEEIKTEETTFTTRTKLRLDHLTELSGIANQDSDDFARWSKTRLDRLIIDYLLRNGFNDTAVKCAQEGGLPHLVDLELFAQSKKVEEALLRHSCTECLQWCNENKSSLKKMKSTLEFNLRIQEYAELIRNRRLSEAIVYAKKHLAPWSDTHIKEIQQATALLAFSPHTPCITYRKYFDESRWNALIQQFRQDNYVLNSLPNQSQFVISLQAGLSALKTYMCYKTENQNIHCPVCSKTSGQGVMAKLAEKLPMAHHVNSCIVCRIKASVMNEDNPPMVLPNGMVYSLEALQEMAVTHNGQIRCPRTGMSFHLNQARKAFIL